MQIKRLWFGVVLLVSFSSVSIAQQLTKKVMSNPIVCYGNPVNKNTILPPPAEYLKWKNNPAARTASTTFEVTYIGFTDEAKAAFQKAVDIWASLLTSPQTIRVTAQWSALDAGVLGSAIWGSVYANFPGAPQANTYYPVALAEKIAQQDLNGTSDPDIVANFSSTTNWSYKTDGTTESGKYDLVTVVLHELGHGLGFVDSYSVNSTGTLGYVGGNDNLPMIYDLFLENNSGKNLFHDFTSATATLKTQLTSRSLYLNSALTLSNNGGLHAKVYAPSTFSAGSSISHLDEATFPSGNINSLMSPQIGMAEVMQDPGPIVKGLFSDIGWVFTTIKHTPLTNKENTAGPFTVVAQITSDGGPVTNTMLHYSIDGQALVDVQLTATGNPDEYAAVIPSSNTASTYYYYISASDNLRSYTNPGKLSATGKDTQQTYFNFVTGTDTTPPVITHTPKKFMLNTATSFSIPSTVTDNLGVEYVKLEYSINNVVQPEKKILWKNATGNAYDFTLDFTAAPLAIGDIITYRIVAHDTAAIANEAFFPSATEYVTVKVLGIKPTQNSYVNNFNAGSEDFYGDDFSIITPTGFTDPAIHSIHPYLAGLGYPNDERNITYELLVPIKVASSNTLVSFKEIVLVEPGETGSVFGSANFYDYVVVEGSVDNGATWKGLDDGYDCRDKSDWLTQYNSASNNENSTALGTPSLYHTRTLDLLQNFTTGQVVMIRFRLYSDPAAVGWGWAIDDLSIQGTVTGTEKPLSPYVHLYPNPTQGMLKVELENQQVSTAAMKILNTQGGLISASQFNLGNGTIARDVDVHDLPAGLYLMKLEIDGVVYTRKFVKE